MSYFSFASNSRAQQTAELISYILNKNSSDRVLKYQISLTELPVKWKNHKNGYRHSGRPSMKGGNNEGSGNIDCFCKTFNTLQLKQLLWLVLLSVIFSLGQICPEDLI